MAKPKYHVLATMILFVLLQMLKLLLGMIITAPNMAIDFILLGFFGVLTDLDHIHGGFIQWWIKFLKHEKVNLPKGWENKFHTFRILAVVMLLSIALGNHLPILAYGIHMLIDGANRANDGPWKGRYSYLPWVIHKYYPLWMQFYRYEEEDDEKKESQ